MHTSKNWILKDGAYQRELTFKNQTELAEFVLHLAKFSDDIDHHADMEIYAYSHLRLRITTHDMGGPTERDLSWIKEADKLIEKLG